MVKRFIVSRLLVPLTFFSVSWSSQAAVTYVGTASSAKNGPVSSLTYSHTVPAGSDRYLVVGVTGWRDTGVNFTVTFNGVSMTELGTVYDGLNFLRVSLFGMVAPAVTTANVVVTCSGSGCELGSGALNFAGVDQTTPIGTFYQLAFTVTGAPSVNVSSAAGEMVVDAVYYVTNVGDAIPTAGASQTRRVGLSPDDWVNIGMSHEDGAASVDMSWSIVSSQSTAIGAIALKPVAAPIPAAVVNNPLSY